MTHRNVSPLPNRTRWWGGLAIMVVGVGLLVLIQTSVVIFSTRPSADFFYAVWGIDAVLFLWLVRFSGLLPKARVNWVAAIAAVHALFIVTVDVDGYAGDGRMIFRWRWSETPEERFERSRVEPIAFQVESSPINEDTYTTTFADYPGFRGADRSGVIRGTQLETDWETHPPQLLWKRPIGRGWSAFAIAAGRCVTQEQRGEFEAVVCYELLTGKELWEHRNKAHFQEVTGGNGPRATPTIHGDRVFALGATGILDCLDRDSGHLHWSVNILKTSKANNAIFGMAGSPLISDGNVIVFPGGKGHSVAAFDAQTGAKVWAAGDVNASYASPHAAELCGQDVVLNFNAEGLFIHDRSTGFELCGHRWISNPEERNNVCQPVPLFDAEGQSLNRVMVASGYGMGAALLEFSPSENGLAIKQLWRSHRLKAKFSSVVVHDGYVYGLDERIMACLDLQTGALKWKGGRYGYGQLILVEDVILVQAEPGFIALVKATPDGFTELARTSALDDRTWNHPALAGEYLLVRNDRDAACLRLPVR